jgi:hypothetical protein
MGILPRVPPGFSVSAVLLCFSLGGLVTWMQMAWGGRVSVLQYVLFGAGIAIGFAGALTYFLERLSASWKDGGMRSTR